MLQRLDTLLRNRSLWCILLLATYVLPALIADVPAALAMPWVLIPNMHDGMYEFLRLFGMPSLYDNNRLLFAFAVHSVFWSLCLLLIVRGKRLSSPVLRSAGVLLMALLVFTIHGCSIAIDALRH